MNRIKELREDRDLRQIDVAMATGIDQKTLSNYETGRTNPDSFAIVKLAKFFNVSTDYLLCYGNERNQIIDSVIQELDTIQSEITKIKEKIIKI